MKKQFKDGFNLITVALPSHPNFFNLMLWIFSRLSAQLLKNHFEEADIIHSVGANNMGVIGSYLARKFHKKHIAQLIGSDVNSILPVIYNQPLIRNWENHIDGISANSLAILNAFQRLYPKIQPTAIVNYRGVDLQLFHPNDRMDNRLTILYLGGLPDYPNLPYGDNTKGGKSLMRIWSKLEDQLASDTDVKLLFGGPGSNKPEVYNWYNRLHFKEKVEILGNVKPETVRKLMTKSNLVVIPSKEEGTPNVGFEALASGLAIIGSNVGGIPELVSKGSNGWLLDPDDESIWLEYFLNIIDGKYNLKDLGQHSRKLAEKHFSHELFSRRLTALYKNILANN